MREWFEKLAVLLRLREPRRDELPMIETSWIDRTASWDRRAYWPDKKRDPRR